MLKTSETIATRAAWTHFSGRRHFRLRSASPEQRPPGTRWVLRVSAPVQGIAADSRSIPGRGEAGGLYPVRLTPRERDGAKTRLHLGKRVFYSVDVDKREHA